MRGNGYKTAISEFCDGGECDPDGVKDRHAEVAAIAARFGCKVERVALDINHAYLASWRPMRGRRFHLLDED